MNEAEWLSCTDVRDMLFGLATGALPRIYTPRQSRLHCIACCRRFFWNALDDQARDAVEVRERFEDGQATVEELNAAGDIVYALDNMADEYRIAHEADRSSLVYEDWWREYVRATCFATYTVVDSYHADAYDCLNERERTASASLLRDIIGNPYRLSHIDSSCLAWNDGTVVKIAQGIYAERAFDRLPVLADALEDAGCYDIHILAHCRQPGQHVRGCWLVDLLTGRSRPRP